jgi:hypothetical protein
MIITIYNNKMSIDLHTESNIQERNTVSSNTKQ